MKRKKGVEDRKRKGGGKRGMKKRKYGGEFEESEGMRGKEEILKVEDRGEGKKDRGERQRDGGKRRMEEKDKDRREEENMRQDGLRWRNEEKEG